MSDETEAIATVYRNLATRITDDDSGYVLHDLTAGDVKQISSALRTAAKHLSDCTSDATCIKCEKTFQVDEQAFRNAYGWCCSTCNVS